MFSVGITDFTCPVRIPEKDGSLQATVARIDLTAQGPDAQDAAGILRGLLLARLPDLHSGVFPALLAEAREQTGADEARITMRFPYFIKKNAPVSGTPSLMEYRCAFSAATDATAAAGDEPELAVEVPVTTLCPCSKEISDAGAHNQRALITLSVRPRALVWLEDLIRLAEGCASGEVYALLKRPDEKFVTEWAYAHPMFVEDVARKVAQQAVAHPDIERFAVSVESFESIHSHNAFALVDSESMALPGERAAGGKVNA